MNFFWIFLGGGLGSVLRYSLGRWVMEKWEVGWPLGTWMVNLAGSFLIGFLLAKLGSEGIASGTWRAFLIVGFCGGVTTFSTFSYENLLMIQSGEHTRLALYVLSSVIFGIVLAYVGWKLG